MTDPLAQPADQTRERPRQVTIASVLLVIFGGLSLMLAMLLLSIVNDESGVPAWLYVLVYAQFLLAGLQVLSGVFVWLGKAWARTAAMVVCVINLVGAVLSLVSGAIPQAITGAAVNIALLWLLAREEPSALPVEFHRNYSPLADIGLVHLLAATPSAWRAVQMAGVVAAVCFIAGWWTRVAYAVLVAALLLTRLAWLQSSGVHDATHLIWPEAAFPFFLTREPDALAQIVSLLKPSTELITGAVRAASDANAHNPRAFNSIYVIDPDGTIRGIYDKVHLVPFGEYLPFQELLERLGLMQLTKVVGGFLSGDRRRAMEVAGAPKMLPLICYEAIFPAAAVPAGEQPGWMVNVTNDGWFGNSSGPYQHLQQAQLLAIAQGLPLVRAANTGISAVIDPVGRITGSLPLGVEGVLDSRLPAAIGPTIYRRYGDYPLLALLLFSLIVVGRRRFRA